MKFTYMWGEVWKFYKYFTPPSPFSKSCQSILRFCYWLILSPVYKFILTLVPRKVDFKYNIAICAIFKNEAPFLREWVEYHLLIGVEHFYLYDNFSDDNFKEILQPYLDDGSVTLIDWSIQDDYALDKAFTDCLRRFHDEAHWVALIDLDEFINVKTCDNINDWLGEYDKYPSIYLYWKHFGASGVMKHVSDTLVIEEYTSCWEHLCDFGKSIINNNFYFPTPRGHAIKAQIKICGIKIDIPAVNDIKCFNRMFYPFWIKNVSAQINHYYIRGFEDRYYKCFKRGFAWSDNVDDYYEYDRITPYESFCTTREFSIQRFLTPLKAKIERNFNNFT